MANVKDSSDHVTRAAADAEDGTKEMTDRKNSAPLSEVYVVPRESGRERECLLGQNAAVRKLSQHVLRVANVQCTALIFGETGTGKSVWARIVHSRGPRSKRPFLPVNCAALPTSLAESQLFGYEKGAFTGATGSSLGIFRAANGGVVLLDEIGELPLDLQPKLLRVLEEGEVRPVGGYKPIPIDVQILAATNRDLEADVVAGRFREDLLYRLNMVELRVPPLRERVEDIPLFIEFISLRCAHRYDRPVWLPDPETLKQFCQYPWPGNIRQLSHVIEQSYVLECAPSLPEARSSAMNSSTLPHFNLSKLRDEAVRQALVATRGHKGRAAKLLGVHANTLTRLISMSSFYTAADE